MYVCEEKEREKGEREGREGEREGRRKRGGRERKKEEQRREREREREKRHTSVYISMHDIILLNCVHSNYVIIIISILFL